MGCLPVSVVLVLFLGVRGVVGLVFSSLVAMQCIRRDVVYAPSVSAFIGTGVDIAHGISPTLTKQLVGFSSKNLQDFPLPATGAFFSILFIGSSCGF